MTMATLSKTAVSRAIKIAKNLNANAVIIETKIGDNPKQMAVSEKAYKNRIEGLEVTIVATVDSTGIIL